jgi:cupin 2 domain-containing protein
MPDDSRAREGSVSAGNLFADVPVGAPAEVFTPLLERAGFTIERIVSNGQASPPGFWYDSERDEWVVLLAGSAALRLQNEDTARVLRPGDWMHLPAGCRHRVEWTDGAQPTVWLAVHLS